MNTNTDIETRNNIRAYLEYLSEWRSHCCEYRDTAEDEDEHLYYKSLLLEIDKAEDKFRYIFRSLL